MVIVSCVVATVALAAGTFAWVRASDGTPVDPTTLPGTTWNIAEGTLDGALVLSADRLTIDSRREVGMLAIEPLAVRLRFDDDSVQVVDGCRDVHVAFFVDGTSIEFGEPDIDDTICDADPDRRPIHSGAILGATTLTMDGDLLRFSGADDEVSFEQVPTTGASLRVDS